MTRASLASVTALLSALVAGCASYGNEQRLQRLDANLRSYEVALRWGEYEAAAAQLEGEGARLDSTRLEQLREIRVTAYEVVRQEVAADGLEALVEASVDYYHERSGAVRTLRDLQRWRYDDATKRWRNQGSLPDFVGTASRTDAGSEPP